MPILVQEKVRQALGILEEKNVDLWITFVRETSAGGDPVLPLIYGDESLTWHSALLLSRSGERIAIVGQYEAHAAQSTGAYDTVIAYDHSIRSELLGAVTRLDPASIAINVSTTDVMADGLTHGMYLTLHEILAGSPYADRLCSSEAVISALRGRKTPTEIARIQAAVHTTEDIYAQVFSFVQPGLRERDVADFMHQQLIQRELKPAWSLEGCPIVNAGPDSPIGHAAPGDLAIQPGQILHLDFGVQQDGYCSDIQRVAYCLAPRETGPPEEVTRGFQTVVEAIQAVVDAMRPGAMGKELDAVARTIITANGYPEFMYATGHQLGRLAHDGGALMGPEWDRYGDSPHQPLEAGQVFTVEPGLVVPGFGYIGIEEDVLVTENGAQFISTPQKKMIVF